MLGINIIAKLLIQFISMELSKEEPEEKPRNLWKEVELGEYQVKSLPLIMIIILLNFYNSNSNDFLIFKSSVSQFLLLMNQKRF